jgi:hypothetical protein
MVLKSRLEYIGCKYEHEIIVENLVLDWHALPHEHGNMLFYI